MSKHTDKLDWVIHAIQKDRTPSMDGSTRLDSREAVRLLCELKGDIVRMETVVQKSIPYLKDGFHGKATTLEQENQRLRDALESVAVAVFEMHNDNRKGDFKLPTLARLDLDECVARATKAMEARK